LPLNIIEMTQPDHHQRLQALRKYNLFESNFNQVSLDAFNLLIESVALSCDAAYGAIYLLQEKGYRLLSIYPNQPEAPGIQFLDDSYFSQGETFVEINDLKEHQGTSEVLSHLKANNIRYLAGCPFFDPDGVELGSILIFDEQPGARNEKQKAYLQKATKRLRQILLDRRSEQVSNVLSMLFDSTDDFLVVTDANGKILKTNSTFQTQLGYESKELLELSLFAIVHPDDRATFRDNHPGSSPGKPLFKFITRLLSKTSATRYVEWVGTREDHTEFHFYMGRDITGVEVQKQRLLKSEKRFRAFFENSQTLSCMHNLQGVFLSVNKIGARMVGFDVEDMVGKSLYDVVTPDRRPLVDEYLRDVSENGAAQGTMRVVTKRGKERSWMYSSVFQHDENGEDYIIANAIDLSERFKLEKELKESKRLAEQASLAKSEFLANMSHEIRTPLNGIIGFTDLVLKTNLDDTQRQYINIINQSGNTLVSIINEILDFSKIEAGKLKLHRERVDLQDIAAQALSIISYAVEKKKLELLFDFSAELPRFVWADETRLKQILVNLLGNAVKFTETGEVELKITPVAQPEEGITIVRFEVRDTGIGIHPSKLDQIFEAFEQEDSSITKKYGGTGLGLTISNRLLKLADSRLHVESTLGKGSCFHFDVAFKSENEDDEISLNEIRKVLVVDDNENNRRILQHMLELKKIEVEAVESGLQALILLQEGKQYDVIIMDYHMPIMDGIETIRKIKGNLNHTSQPIIMLYSSSDDDVLQEACEELEVDSRLVKPIKMREMYQVLAQLKKESKEKEISATAARESRLALRKGLKVLIAEDNEVNMFLSKSIVRQIAPDCLILEAVNGKQAVERYLESQPDIILMDVQMPLLNGIEATKQIRSLQRSFHVPILALTAGAMNEEREKCLAAGMDDFMTKPVVKKTMSMMFSKWVGANLPQDDESEQDTGLEHIDRAWFEDYTSADPVFKTEFVNLLLRELKESKKNLQRHVRENDLDALKKAGHKLKGTSLTAGLTELSKLSVAFELLSDTESSYIEELLDKTINELDLLIELLQLEL